MSGSDTGLNRNGPVARSWVKDYLIPFGSVLVATLGLLGGQLPRWAMVIAASYFVVVVGLVLHPFGVRVFSRGGRAWRFHRTAKAYFPRLSESVKGLQKLVAEGHADTLLYVLRETSALDEVRGRSLVFDSEHVETLRSWVSSVAGRVEQRKQDDFSNLCRELSQLVHRYNRFCCQGSRKLQEVVAAGTLPEQRLRRLKQQWNTHRQSHIAFVRDWGGLSSAINASACTQLCLDYYEPLETLE